MTDDHEAGRLRNVIREAIALDPEGALEHIQTLPGARQDPDALAVSLVQWEQQSRSISGKSDQYREIQERFLAELGHSASLVPSPAEPESRSELRKRIVTWARISIP